MTTTKARKEEADAAFNKAYADEVSVPMARRAATKAGCHLSLGNS
jgi:hypothetical protein